MGHRIGQGVAILNAAFGDFHHHPGRIKTGCLQQWGQKFAVATAARHHQRRHIKKQPASVFSGLALKIAQVQQATQAIQIDQTHLVQPATEEPKRCGAATIGIVEAHQTFMAHHPAGAQSDNRLTHSRQTQAAILTLPDSCLFWLCLLADTVVWRTIDAGG